ncbi:MAG: phosphodiester glycosidase family protein [Defluviitaleaceae bacterium]|nr:phosphodiester glycosidase family protein [Defluviitaleaceae bacterium]
MIKGIFFACVALLATITLSTTTFAVDIFFEYRQRETVSRGVEYELNRMMTSRGMLDVHVLWVNLNEPHITLAPTISTRELGRRETTQRLLSDAGAVAGINADFFGMTGTHTVHFGPMANDGELLAINAGTNHYGAEELFAAFLLDMHNNPFFMYLQATIPVYINGVHAFNAGTYNTLGAQVWTPMVADRHGMADTSALDERLENLTKLVVVNNIITHISAPGETVTVPEDGFIIVLPTRMNTEYYMNRFHVGNTAFFRVDTAQRIDFSQIQAAIGGGGLILSHGQTVTDDGGAAPTGRHPRSAIGVTRDGRILMMVVDGRSHSVGVTHAELAALLRHYHVDHAMHFDGGGSTTMVTRDRGGVYSVVNTPSDGSQRQVVNALGVFDNSPIGAMARITLEMENRAIVGVPLSANVFAEDIWHNRLSEINVSTLTFTSQNPSGFWDNGQYTPLATGLHVLEVSYGQLRATASIYVYTLAELRFNVPSINLLEGGRTTLRFSGIATDGTQVVLPTVTGLTVHPPHLGRFEGNDFVATGGGVGYIAAAVGAVRQYIPVSIGGFPWSITMENVNFTSYPATYVNGTVLIDTTAGRNILRLNYSISESERTQAAYINFHPALTVPSTNPTALRVSVYGDGSGHWIRGRIRDGEGNPHTIDFTRNANFTGWQTLTATIPSGLPTPLTVDRLWAAALDAPQTSTHAIRFDNLEALFAPTETANVPQGTVFTDPMRASAGFTGTAAPIEFTIPTEATPYNMLSRGDFAVVTLDAVGGGIASTYINQWSLFMGNIRSVNPNYVVILLNANPRNFNQRMEYELFHAAMTQLRAEGREVFVVSSSTGASTFNMRDGIRYINVTHPAEGSPTIRFWTCCAELVWAI